MLELELLAHNVNLNNNKRLLESDACVIANKIILEIWPCVPGGKDSHTLNRKGLKNAVLQDDAALQVSKFFENPLWACMYFAQKK